MKAITNPNAQHRIPVEVFLLMLNEPIPEGVKLGKWAYGYFSSGEKKSDNLRFTIPGKTKDKHEWVEITLNYGKTTGVARFDISAQLKCSLRRYRANNADVEHLQRTADI